MTQDLETQELQTKDYHHWNTLLKQNSYAKIYYTLEWKQVLQKTFSYKPEYLIAKNVDEIVGVCLVYKKEGGNKIYSKKRLGYKTQAFVFS